MADATLHDPETALRRITPLEGRYATGHGVAISPVPPRLRVSLRCDESRRGDVGAALGLELPAKPKSSISTGAPGSRVTALWIGPDEWMVVSDEAGLHAENPLMERLEAVDGVSAVDVSHRDVSLRLDGPAAEAVLSAACPQDLRLQTFPVGSVSRTVFGKAEVIVWRTGENRFEISCWRSFADYVWKLASEAARSPAL